MCSGAELCLSLPILPDERPLLAVDPAFRFITLSSGCCSLCWVVLHCLAACWVQLTMPPAEGVQSLVLLSSTSQLGLSLTEQFEDTLFERVSLCSLAGLELAM